ncbi:LuxR C-terminal-related transcriptional regulator [Spirillospora sp. CA-255316]
MATLPHAVSDGRPRETAPGLAGRAVPWPLPASKLAVPDVPDGAVARPRLGALLDSGVKGPITLLTAPAGWGKTALLAWWARSAERRLGWLSLEPGDERRFWPCLWAALRTAEPLSGGPSLTALAGTLTGLRAPVVLVLDGFHEIHDPAVMSGLQFLLRHAGARLRLVIATRADPGPWLARWRLGGAVTELDAADLSFTAEETADLLGRQGPAVPCDCAESLRERTEGWPAGLRLAAHAMRGHPDPLRFADRLTGDHDGIARYLAAEVLATLPEEAVRALLAGSVVERLSGSLLDALVGGSGGERVLAGLGDLSGFVVPLDDRRSWYRLHRLFGESLRAELGRRAAWRIPELHRRAAAWYEGRGLPRDALRHATAAPDWAGAADLLVRHWHELLLSPHDQEARTPAPQPPDAALRDLPELALALAADRQSTGDLNGASGFLTTAGLHARALPGDRRRRLEPMAEAVRLAQARLTGDVGAALSSAPRMLALLRRDEDRDDGRQAAAPPSRAGERARQRARAGTLLALGWARLADGDLGAAKRALAGALTAAERAGAEDARPRILSRLAAVLALRGELRDAAQAARTALRLAPCRPADPEAAHAYLALALVHHERDRIDDAGRYLDLATLPRGCPGEQPLIALTALVRAWVQLACCDLPHAHETLRAVRRDLGAWAPPRHLAHLLAAAEADLRIAHGDTGTAAALLASRTERPETAAPLAVVLACTRLRDGDPAGALRVIARSAGAARAVQQQAVRLRHRLLEALAADRLGDGRKASQALEAALGSACEEGFLRVFRGEGPPALHLLAGHLDSGTAHRPFIAELLRSPGTGAGPDGGRPPPDGGTPLTEREATVLRHLPGVLTTEEIAAELYVSVNTVKTHLRHIYRKLGATGRRDAVRKARAVRLL